MSIRLVFLGTGGSVPTLKRGLPAVAMQFPKEIIMFDCGEGVQRQMMGAKVSFHREMKVLISHLHGDHVLGLPGLLQTMALMERKYPIEVYGPVGLIRFMQCTQETLNFGLNYPITITEIQGEGVVCNEKEYQVLATKSNHTIDSYCFAFVEKPRAGKFYPKKALALGIPAGELWSMLQNGEEVTAANGTVVKPCDVMGLQRTGRKIVYTGDTKPFEGFAGFAKDADLIIHDCTFDDAMTERADKDGHSTPSQAATQAKAAGAKRLVLSHISARFPDATELLVQAKKVFPHTLLAKDYLELELPLKE